MGCMSHCIVERRSDLCFDKWFHPIVARQAQPERSTFRLKLDR